MSTTQHTEIERKLDVPCDGVVPDLSRLPGVHAVGPTSTHHLAADYWDTRRIDLARHHISLRRRTGGTDAGWHLKIGAGADARAEHACELGDGPTPPDALVALVRDVVGEHPLHVVARIDTRREETPLLDPSGAVLARFCDDLVVSDTPVVDGSGHAARPARPDPSLPTTTQWREWEVELADGGRDLLAATTSALIESGAHEAAFPSKLARALGDRLASSTPSPLPGGAKRRRASTTDVLRLRLRTQVDALEAQEQGVHAGHASAIHDMRVAARRLRAALRTFEPVLEKGSTIACRRELRWLGGVLGTARDAEVLRGRLTAQLETLSGSLDLGPPVRRIRTHLQTTAGAGQEAAETAMTSARYEHLLDDLERFIAHPPTRPEASTRATVLVPGLLRRDADRFFRAARRARRALPPQRDVALHETRKAAKQLRYSAESASAVRGTSARRIATRATQVQESLGDHQDAVVARELLRELKAEARTAGEDTTPYDALTRLEVAAAAAAVSAYERQLRRLRQLS